MYDKKKQKKTSVDVKVLIKINVLHGIVHLFCADLKWIDKAAVVWRRLFSTIVLSPRHWIVGCYLAVVCGFPQRSMCVQCKHDLFGPSRNGTLFHWFIEWLFVPFVRLHFDFFFLASNQTRWSCWACFPFSYAFFSIGFHTLRLIFFTKLQENEIRKKRHSVEKKSGQVVQR